jgi:putative membrane protein
MMDGWSDGMGGGWGAGEWIMLVLAVVFVVAVIVGIAYLLRGLSGGDTSGGAQGSPGRIDSPEDILKRRYAAGEIDREDYESRLRDLRA